MEVLVLEQLKELNLRQRNKMTEKNYNPKQKERKSLAKQTKVSEPKTTIETPKKEKISQDQTKQKKPETEIKETKEKSKIEPKKKEKPKKTEAVVNSFNLPISTKDCIAICKFIKRKTITDALSDLEQVLRLKKAIPMKGEIPHRKGKGMMSGRYATKAVGNFIKLLKSLLANTNSNGLENPVIVEAVANIGSRPFGKFGRVRKKRTHVKIKAKEQKEKGEKIK